MSSIGGTLRQFRLAADLTQEELAECSGVSVRAISYLENGRTRRPNRRTVVLLARALRLEGPAADHLVQAARPHLQVSAQAEDLATVDQPQLAHRVPVLPRAGQHERGVPRQLPAGTRHFAGRVPELKTLNALLDETTGAVGSVVISAIGGMAGVGKTALALRWAHEAASRFPDGQLYVNLRGFGPAGGPMPPAAAIRSFLDALGVAAEQIPVDLDAQTALYRSLMSDKHMLVLLDNARDAGQVRPLLPGTPGCLVVVTSRSHLAGLVASEGAHALTLDVLSEAEARELLALRLGARRLGAASAAAAEIIGLCARLPLALAITAARASARPGFRLDALVEELQGTHRRLDALETSDTSASVRAVFSWSLACMPPPAAHVFGLLGLHPGPDITTPAAASLAGVSLAQARLALGQLTEAHLVSEHAPGRFSLHDLLRAYAAEQVRAAGGDTAVREAIGRTLDHYLHTAHTAALLLNPSREPVTLGPSRPGVSPEHLADHRQALAWFKAEHDVLISAVSLAVQTGFDTCGWQLPWAMANFLDWRGHWHEWAATQRAALASATRLGDTAAQATAHRLLSHACARFADFDQARAHLTDCLKLYQQVGDSVGQAHVHQTLCWLAAQQNWYEDALGHAELALVLFRGTGNQPGQAEALNNVGCSYASLGDYPQAQTFCQQALSLYCTLGDLPGEASSWDSLGYSEHQLGNLFEAASCYIHALNIFRELGNRYCQADTLTRLGDTHHAAGEEEKAQDDWRQALAIFDELHHSDAARVRVKLRQPKTV